MDKVIMESRSPKGIDKIPNKHRLRQQNASAKYLSMEAA